MDIRLKGADTARMPCLPQTLLALLELFHKEGEDLRLLSRTIRTDAALSAKMIAVASGRKQAFINLDHTLNTLGLDTIRTIVVSASSNQLFYQLIPGHATYLQQFWQHSLECAVVAQLLAGLSHYSDPGSAYVGGLLHGLGHLALWTNQPEEYSELLAIAEDQTSLRTLEQERFGVSHDELGRSLIDSLNMHPFIADAVGYHQEPVDKILDAHPLVKIVALASRLTRDTEQADVEAADRLLEVAPDQVMDLLVEAKNQVMGVAKSLYLNEGSDDQERLLTKRLSEEIRDIALLGQIRRQLAKHHEESDLLAAVQQSAHVLFGFPSVTLFLYDSKNHLVCSKAPLQGAESIADLRIPLEENRSLVSKTLLTEASVTSFGKTRELSVVDRQLIRLLGGNGMFCLPMLDGKQKIGVLVLGVDETQMNSLSEPLLNRFVGEVASILSIFRGKQQQQDDLKIEDRRS